MQVKWDASNRESKGRMLPERQTEECHFFP